MTAVRYTASAARDLKRYRHVAGRLIRALGEYADTGAHASQVTQLVGEPRKRLRVGDWRIVFEETDWELVVFRIAPRGRVYE